MDGLVCAPPIYPLAPSLFAGGNMCGVGDGSPYAVKVNGRDGIRTRDLQLSPNFLNKKLIKLSDHEGDSALIHPLSNLGEIGLKGCFAPLPCLHQSFVRRLPPYPLGHTPTNVYSFHIFIVIYFRVDF